MFRRIYGYNEKQTGWVKSAEQTIGNSQDVEDLREYAKWFIKQHPTAHITFVGHSKGGAEALINAVYTHKEAIVFNPAEPNLTDIGLNASDYSGTATSYVVNNEILNCFQGSSAIESIGNVVYLPE